MWRAQNSAEVKPNIDKLIPVPDTANVPPPTLADIKDATPPAPAVTVAPPTPNPIPASAEAPALDPAAPTATLALPEQPAPPTPTYTGKDLVKAPLAT